MNKRDQTIFDLISQLSQLLEHHIAATTFPQLSEAPLSPADFIHLSNQLITEGHRHHTETWAAHMTSSISSASLLGQVLAGLHNGNLLSSELYPLLEKIEKQLIAWFCSQFHQQYGHFTAGSTYANLEALWHARETAINDSTVVYGSHAAHYSIHKACQILGLTFVAIDSDEFDRIIPQALELACQRQMPTAVVLTVGTSACGEIDPIDQCVSISNNYQSWCHIDAAWGGALALLPEYQPLFDESFIRADSVCFDPHKGLNQPKPCGLLLYQKALQPMFMADANYIEQQPLQTLPGSSGGELFLPLWASLMSSGVQSLQVQIRRRLQQAEVFASQIKKNTNWWVHLSDTGIVCFRPPKEVDLNSLVTMGIFSRAKVQHSPVYRAVFACPATQASALITVLQSYF